MPSRAFCLRCCLYSIDHIHSFLHPIISTLHTYILHNTHPPPPAASYLPTYLLYLEYIGPGCVVLFYHITRALLHYFSFLYYHCPVGCTKSQCTYINLHTIPFYSASTCLSIALKIRTHTYIYMKASGIETVYYTRRTHPS